MTCWAQVWVEYASAAVPGPEGTGRGAGQGPSSPPLKEFPSLGDKQRHPQCHYV